MREVVVLARQQGFYSDKTKTKDIEIGLYNIWRRRNYWATDQCFERFPSGGKLPDLIFDKP